MINTELTDSVNQNSTIQECVGDEKKRNIVILLS